MCLESQSCSMGVSSTKAPARGGGTRLRKEKFLAKFRRDPILVPITFLEPGQSPSSAVLGGPVLESMATAFATEMEEVVAEIKRLCQKHICLAQEAEDAAQEREWLSNWMRDLMDQRHEIKAEIWRLEQDLNSKKEELAQLEARKKELEASGLKGPIVASSVSGLSQGGASAETRAPTKKKKNKQETPWPALTREAGVL